MSDWFYALRVSSNHRASKGYCLRENKWWREYDYNAGWEFDAFRSGEFNCLDGLANAIKRIESRRNFFVIRGELISGEQKASAVNRRAGNLDDGKLPCWRAQDRQWAMFDIDTIDWTGPRIVSQSQYEVELKDIITSLLPNCFHGVSFFYQLSSSAGLSKSDDGSFTVGHEKLKVHLWYWLERAVCDASIRQWICGNELPIDHAPFNPVQPHFTSVPEFVGGDDPVGFRSGLVRGASHVLVLPDCVLSGQDYAKKTQRRKVSTISFYDKARFEGGAIPRAVAKILSVTNGRHHELNRQAFTLGGLIGNGTIDYNDAFEQIINASIIMGVLPSEAARIAAAGLDLGMTRPFEIAEKEFVESKKHFTAKKFSLGKVNALSIDGSRPTESYADPMPVKEKLGAIQDCKIQYQADGYKANITKACDDLAELYDIKMAATDGFCLFDDRDSRHISLTLKEIWSALRRSRYNYQFNFAAIAREITSRQMGDSKKSYLLYLIGRWLQNMGFCVGWEITDKSMIYEFDGLTSIIVNQIGVASLKWPQSKRHPASQEINFQHLLARFDFETCSDIGHMSQRSYYALGLFVELVNDDGQKSYVFELQNKRKAADSDLVEFQLANMDVKAQFVWDRLRVIVAQEYAAMGEVLPEWCAEAVALHYVNASQNRRNVLMNDYLKARGAI
jgi:hypothetical protein